jgi:hypothetical protein
LHWFLIFSLCISSEVVPFCSCVEINLADSSGIPWD